MKTKGVNIGVKNTAANLASRIWGMLSTFMFLPLFLRLLGEEAYGLVTMFSTLQVALTLLGLGFSSALRREFAKGDSSYDNKEYKRKLLKTVELFYVIICVVIVLLCWCSSDYISTRWLNIVNLDCTLVAKSITLMGVSIAIQLFNNLWQGCLLGLNYQVRANIYYISWAAIRNIAALFVCIYSSNIFYFYCAYIICDVIYSYVLRIYLGRCLDNKCKSKWHFSDISLIKTIWKYTVGLLLISILSLLLTQFDKIILSKFMTLAEVGAYNSIITLGSLTRVVSSAVSITVLTEFTQMFSLGKSEQLERRYLAVWKYVSIVTICIVVYVAVFSETIMIVWTGNTNYAAIAKMCAPYLLCGIGGLALQEIPYSYILAKGNTKINVFLGILILPVFGISDWWAIQKYGMLGASIVYGIIFTMHTVVYLAMVNKDISQRSELKKVYYSILFSCGLSLLCALGSRAIISSININFLRLLCAVLSGGICCACMLLAFGIHKKKFSDMRC